MMGMQPSGGAPEKRLRWLGPMAGPVSRFLNGGAVPSDPFYLTNRTLGQKVGLALLIAIPCLLVIGGIGLAGLGYFDNPPATSPPTSAEQAAARTLPDLDKDINIPVNRDVEVVDAHVEQGPVTKLTGTARNNTGRTIHDAELIFDLTDAAGSRLGAVSARVAAIAPKGTTSFSIAIEQRNAAFALVREIRL